MREMMAIVPARFGEGLGAEILEASARLVIADRGTLAMHSLW
jgi:hypothetical protein